MLETKTRIVQVGDSRYLLLPSDLISDSAFPFTDNRDLNIKIQGNKLTVSQ